MKRIMPVICLLLIIGFLSGCVTAPVKIYQPLPKTNTIFLAEPKVFKGLEVTLGGRIKNLGKPADDDPYYQEVAKEYLATLRKNLKKVGFMATDKPNSQTLILETNISDSPPPLGGFLGILAMGIVAVQIEVKQNGNLLLSFGEAVNTTLGYKAKGQIKRHLAPRVAKKLNRILLLK